MIADTEDNLQRLLFKFGRVEEMFNMEISTEKTKELAVSKELVRYKLEIKNKIMEQVMSFTYLGVEITSG